MKKIYVKPTTRVISMEHIDHILRGSTWENYAPKHDFAAEDDEEGTSANGIINDMSHEDLIESNVEYQQKWNKEI